MITKPILFTGEMVRAIPPRDDGDTGPKTMTRRLSGLKKINECPDEWKLDTILASGNAVFNRGNGCEIKKVRCPYGVPGDLLWVRETYQRLNPCEIRYRADHPGLVTTFPWTPSIFMPRTESRLTLRVSNIRVERVRNISGVDAVAEGCGQDFALWELLHCGGYKVARTEFIALWNSIHGPGAWERNDWVWIPEWDKVWTQNVDLVMKEFAA
jgi:hypothetical protein